jgi:transposase
LASASQTPQMSLLTSHCKAHWTWIVPIRRASPKMSFFDRVYDDIPENHYLRATKQLLEFSLIRAFVAKTYDTIGRLSHQGEVSFGPHPLCTCSPSP